MSGQVLVANKATKIPPFLKKLVDLTNSCPPHIGGWNEDGTHFVVRSSQFADLLREQFQGTLQTFVRQLHFYSFTKKDDVSTGVWTFSHPHFLRGQAHLLVNIGRKSNPKRKKSKDDDDDAASEGSGDQSSKNNQMNAAVEARLVYLERQLTRMTSLERELQALKQEVTQFRELHAAQNLLSLAPGIARKRTADEADRKEVVTPISSQVMTSKVLEKEEALSMLPPLKKVTRMTSVDSAFEMKDFPFEDTSSLGSVSVRDLMRELQFGLFADFDEFMPVASKFTATDAPVPATPMSDSSAELSGKAPCSMNKEDYFKIPKDFVFQPGVTRALLKQTFNVITKLVCPSTTEECPEALRRICEERPHPSSLPPVEVCEIANAMLPYLKDGIEDKVEDIVLLRASRQVYEIFYACVQKKFQDLSGVSTQAHKQIPMQSGMQH